MPVHTLRRNLFKRLLWPLIPILLTGTVFAYLFALHMAMTAYDLGLLNDALDLAKQVEIQQGNLAIDLPLAAQQMLQVNNEDRESYAAWDDRDRLFSGNAELLTLIKNSNGKDRVFEDIVLDGEENRAIVLQQRLYGRTFYVAVSQTVRGRDRLTGSTFAGILLPEALLALISVAAVLWGVRNGLLPVEALRDEIESRSSNDLRPLEESSAPAELAPIIHSINELFSKLESSFANHRRFIADAAHQLRTPLASLSIQIELGLNSPPADVEAFLQQLLLTTRRTTHLSNQLLSLAKLEYTELYETSTVDLRQLFLEISGDFVSLAARKGVDIDFDLMPLAIEGNAWMVREMLTNLLNNAVLYTPPNGKVHIRLHIDCDDVWLVVVNNGPVISSDELGKLGMPFYRPPSSPPGGCGLGLAIVKEIVRVHGGKVYFEHGINGEGLQVQVQFPSSPIGLAASLQV